MEISQIKQFEGLKILEQQLPEELKKYYQQLFKNSKSKNSTLHFNKRIILNNNLNPLLLGQYYDELKSKSIEQYFKLKKLVCGILLKLCQIFKLNCKFIKDSFIIKNYTNHQNENNIDNNHQGVLSENIPFIMYLINQIYISFEQVSDIYKKYQQQLLSLYYYIAKYHCFPTNQLQSITQLLTNHYYNKTLTIDLIEKSFRLIQSGLQEKIIQPYLYFIYSQEYTNAIKVLYHNPSSKFIFNKGMTVWIWFETMTMLEESNKNQCTLFMMKTDVNHKLQVKLLKNMDLEISSWLNNKECQIIIITSWEHKIKINSSTMIAFQLQAIDNGFLKSNSYSLNMKINSNFYKEAIIPIEKMPKFTQKELITDFILFDKFIGKVYSILISNKPQLTQYQAIRSKFSHEGICNENRVWELIDSNHIKKQNIIGIFNAERSFESILINYVDSKNIACYSGLFSREKYIKYDEKIIDVFFPYLYFLIISRDPNQIDKFHSLCDMLIKNIIVINSSDTNPQINSSENILFLLYFLELSNYQINQSTLDYLVEQIKSEKYEQKKYYYEIICKYLDLPTILSKNLHLTNLQQLNIESDPVQKIQLMFYLQTIWKQKWMQFQSWALWWTPKQFQYQNNQEFSQNIYKYNEKKQTIIQWEVRNFVSNDFCKNILKPVFKIPEYANLNKYQKQYILKQCNTQNFNLVLDAFPVRKKFFLRKQAISPIDRIKKKLLRSQKDLPKSPTRLQKVSSTRTLILKNSITTHCLYVDLLSVIISTIKITQSGFMVISSRHNNKFLDHMCVKAFNNDRMLYKTFHLSHIKYIRKRRFNQSNNTLEIKLKSGEIYLLWFYKKDIDQFISILEEHIIMKKDPYAYYLSSQQPFKWVSKQMSNYQYIQWLNDVAGRNFLDIAQYPVLPWVFVANSEEELREEKGYRNLIKNMGSHGTEERVKHFLEKYSSYNEHELFNQYHFGTHYSSSAIIFNFLIRIRPFSVGAYTLQSGKFDCADRVFGSYIGSWFNCTNSPADVRQLIPEIYTLPQMFLNVNNYDFGMTQDKSRIDNVTLPKWANLNPYKFISMIRKKLQSPYVSQNINHWIDLIFGYKQRGQQAIDSMNIYFPLTYEDSVNLDKVQDADERISFETQIAHFGQNPSQIIGNNPHPIRMKSKVNWEGRLISDAGQNILIQRINLQKNRSIEADKNEKYLYKSIFESKDSILSLQFLDELRFLVLRKHQYLIYKIINKKDDFIYKQSQIKYELESIQISIDYKQIRRQLPVAVLKNSLLVVGGFYNGYVQFIFSDQYKYNQSMKFDNVGTITAIDFTKIYQLLYIGDHQGFLKVYQINFVANNSSITTNGTNSFQKFTFKEIEFTEINSIKLHCSKVNSISINQRANLAVTCSEDGYAKIINLYTQEIYRIVKNPDYEFGENIQNSILFCQISISPLYSIIFYSEKSKKLYSYSINGQFLSSFSFIQGEIEENEFIFNMKILPSTDTTEKIILQNSLREVFILQMPFLELKRKIKLKKDIIRTTCFRCCPTGKMILTGYEDGGLQMICDPACY